MDTNIKLSQKAYEYLDHGDTKSAEKILNMLKKKENTPELKFTISALLIEIGTVTKKMEYIEDSKKANGAHLFRIPMDVTAPEDLYFDFKLPS